MKELKYIFEVPSMSRARMESTFSEVFLNEFEKGESLEPPIIPKGFPPCWRKNPVVAIGAVRLKSLDSAIDLHTHRTVGETRSADPVSRGIVRAGTS